MKQKEAELLITRFRLEVARGRVEALETAEHELLVAMGRDPNKPGVTFELKSKKDVDAAFAFLQSPEFSKRLRAASKVVSKAFLAIEKREFKKSKWAPLSTAHVRGRVRR